MALINCPECKQPVSTEAHTCPHCGFPIAEKYAQHQAGDAEAGAPQSGEPLAEVRSSWWSYFWYFFFFWLIVPPILAIFRRKTTLLQVFPDRIRLTRGLASKGSRDYKPRDIRSIDIDQTLLQRMVGIGDLTISTAASTEGTELMHSIPQPQAVRDLILSQRRGQ
ncbi:MAG TPA: PH domain-containing protein [Candidatus Acidoferrum sp.]|nr:PH domain-containing protein [Candidatus Acidoferrum sp.]